MNNQISGLGIYKTEWQRLQQLPHMSGRQVTLKTLLWGTHCIKMRDWVDVIISEKTKIYQLPSNPNNNHLSSCSPLLPKNGPICSSGRLGAILDSTIGSESDPHHLPGLTIPPHIQTPKSTIISHHHLPPPFCPSLVYKSISLTTWVSPIPITLLITSVFEEHSPSKTSSMKTIRLPFCSLNSYSCGSKSDNLTISLPAYPSMNHSGLLGDTKICCSLVSALHPSCISFYGLLEVPSLPITCSFSKTAEPRWNGEIAHTE